MSDESILNRAGTIMDKMFGTLLALENKKTKIHLTPLSMLKCWVILPSLGCQRVTSTLYRGERGERLSQKIAGQAK